MSKKIGFGLLSLLCSFIGTVLAQSESKPILAVFPLEANGVSERMATEATQCLQDELALLGCHEIVPSEKTYAATTWTEKTQGLSRALEMAKKLSAEKLVRGTLGREGLGYVLLVKSISVDSGRVLAIYSARRFSSEELTQHLKTAAAMLDKCSPTTASAPGQLAETKPHEYRGSIDTDLLRERLSPANRRLLDLSLNKRKFGYTIGIPSWIVCGLVAIPYLRGIGGAMFGGPGISGPYAGVGLLIALPAAIVGGIGLKLVLDANEEIKDLAASNEQVRMGFNLNPEQRLYGFSISFNF